MHWPTCAPYFSVVVLNALFFVFCAAQTLAYLTPYLPYSLRKFGTPTHNITFALLFILALLTGAYNCFAIYSWRRGKFIFGYRTRRRTRRLSRGTTEHYYWVSPTAGTSITSASRTSLLSEKEIRPSFVARLRTPKYWLVALLYVFVAALPILTVFLARDLSAGPYWRNACKGHHLVAEVIVQYPKPTSDRDIQWNVTTRVNFYADGEWQYEMDLLKVIRDPLTYPADGFEDEERMFIFSIRNSSRPFVEGSNESPPDVSYSNPLDGTQHFPDLPYLPILNTSVLSRAFAPRPVGWPQTATIPYNDEPLYGLMSPMANDAPIARVTYRLGRDRSQYSYTEIARPATGQLINENQGNISLATTRLEFDGPTSFNSPAGHRWRWKHPNILRGERRAEACLPPNPSLYVPLYLQEQIGHAVAMPPAFWTPWVPKNLQALRRSERCRKWRVCALPKGGDGKSGGVQERRSVRNSARAEKPAATVGGLQQWRKDVDKTWAVAMGLLAFEVESWSACCQRGE